MKKSLIILICLVVVAAAVGGAYAQFAKPEYAIKYRKAVMFLIAQHFGRLGAMVKEQVPYNQKVFTDNAMVVETLSRLPWEAMMEPATDKGDTTLNAAVFAKPTEFNTSAQAFEDQAARLVSIARSGDFAAVKTQFGEVGKSCKACHDAFRTK